MYDDTPMKKCHALQPRKEARHGIEAVLSNHSSHTPAGMVERCYGHARGAGYMSAALIAHIMPPKPHTSTAGQKLWDSRPLESLATFESLLYFG